MSALDFLVSGGVANVGGDLPEQEQQLVNTAIRAFGAKVRARALALQVPASQLLVRQASFLFIGKDTGRYHIIFALAPGSAQISYRDLTAYGRLELNALAHQVRSEVGDVVWAFSLPLPIPQDELDQNLDKLVAEYLNSVLQAQRTPERRVSQEAAVNPEIASGLEKFRADHGGKRAAFIMMQFTKTAAHDEIVSVLKRLLAEKDIIGLRADDKQYMDDLFPNIKVYMHACDFGIGVFERITEDEFNPNLSLEVGYMLGLGKDVLLLKDKTLHALPTDLIGRLYRQFDTRDVSATIPSELERWLLDKGWA